MSRKIELSKVNFGASGFIASPIEKLNQLLLGGFRQGSLYAIGSVPAMGKSSLLETFAVHACLSKKKVLFLTPRKPNECYINFLGNASEVEIERIKLGLIYKVEADRISDCGMKDCDIELLHICDLLGFKEKINFNLEELFKINSTDMIIIDDVEFLIYKDGKDSLENYSNSLRVIENLKILAVKLDIPIIFSTTLSRKSYERVGHRPILNDFKLVGGLEIPDVVISILRREYFDPLDRPGMAELMLAKNSSGSIGTINTTFRKELRQFVDYMPLKYEIDPSEGHPFDMDEIFKSFSEK